MPHNLAEVRLKIPPIDILLGLAFTIFALLRPVWQRVKNLPARSWMTVQGTVVSATVSKQHGFVPSYLVRIAYRYISNGDYYSGFHQKSFLRKQSAERFATGVKGQMAFVRQKPNAPERSALLEQDQYGWPS
jgi:Protein of unknown function (DUF3592)